MEGGVERGGGLSTSNGIQSLNDAIEGLEKENSNHRHLRLLSRFSFLWDEEEGEGEESSSGDEQWW